MNGRPPKDQARELAVLRDEVEQLREEVRQFRETFCGPLPLLHDLGLSRQESAILAAIYRSLEGVTRNAIHVAVCGFETDTDLKVIDVYVHKLRKRMGQYGITIETIWGTGYRLTPESRAKIRDLVDHKPRQKLTLMRNQRAAG